MIHLDSAFSILVNILWCTLKHFAEDFGQTALGNFSGAPNLGIFGYKPRPKTKSYVPYSLREEIGFFYVPTLILSYQSFSWPFPIKGLSLRMRNGWGEEGDKSLIKLATCDIWINDNSSVHCVAIVFHLISWLTLVHRICPRLKHTSPYKERNTVVDPNLYIFTDSFLDLLCSDQANPNILSIRQIQLDGSINSNFKPFTP